MSTCTTLSRALTEPLAATAGTARTWLLIEQPGPWGPDALVDSHLDPAVGRALEAATAGTGVRVALIRRPGRHADRPGAAAGHRAYLAHTLPGNAWVRVTERVRPEALLDLDFARLGAGLHDGRWEPHRGAPLTLVCTNGRRDRCCALLGRPLAAELVASGGSEVWEITHIGGHRFSPTLLVLPHGYAYGRMTAVGVKGVLAALDDGQLVTDGCRGRSAWDRPGQAAELAVREATGEQGLDALAVLADRGPDGIVVGHADGRRWRVTVAELTDGAPAPASCGALFEARPRMAVTGVVALTGAGQPPG
ncbi:sucrase ferredoxin [Streptomyces hainanensis]|uniref:Sucrase ferredoxin n=1 Tax=Streptomyces hainanensis TaxID=402648 RepID=A0A4R4TN71_9ACTN|nr:sucrase ferredoxin [Streptomyces hainanensis]TDC79467.1 sucrase ferredoxin [Streptomyces hainanensis]